MENCEVLILGSGHLAYRVAKLAGLAGYKTLHIQAKEFNREDPVSTPFERIHRAIGEIDLSKILMTYVVDSNDDFNLEILLGIMSLEKDVPVTAALFNEKLAPHLRDAHSRLYIMNPARIAAPAFVEALYGPVTHKKKINSEKQTERFSLPSDNLLKWLVILFLLFVGFFTLYFHYIDNLGWVDAIYFVTVTISTVGYGDINLKDAGPVSKIAAIVLIVVSTIMVWMIFSLIIDAVIKKRIQLALGRKKYSMKGHVILCGLGRVGYFIAEELLKRNEKLIIVESNENSQNIPHFRNIGANIYIGDARLPRILKNVCAENAKALISVINNDFGNLEIGLNARSFNPDLKIILRFFDDTMAAAIEKRLDIYHTLSMSKIADEYFLKTIMMPVPKADKTLEITNSDPQSVHV
jgi:voltage-gated potassium channel Kch